MTPVGDARRGMFGDLPRNSTASATPLKCDAIPPISTSTPLFENNLYRNGLSLSDGTPSSWRWKG